VSRPWALVTGGARRLGAHLCRYLAARGYGVLVHYRSSEGPAQELVAEIVGNGGHARAIRADLEDLDSIAAMFADLADREGSLALLINNVGNYDPKPLSQVTPHDWNRLIAANLNGAWACCWHARKLMKRGQIVNLGYAGVDALVANPDATPYQVSKTGLLVLTKSMAAEWGPDIRANMLSPGQLENSIDLPERVAECVPAGRAGTLQDMAQALGFLLDADYITGQNIDVAGGYRLRGSVPDPE